MPASRRILRLAAPGAGGLLLLAFLTAPPPAAAQGRRAAGSTTPAERLREIHGLIETAFGRGDARTLRGAFSRRLKTYIAAPDFGIANGYYGTDQAVSMLRRLFEGRTTLRFTFEAPGNATPRDGLAVIPARWIYREEGTPKAEVRLSFTLATEGAAWQIREIRELK
jgi:hypothetical protein